MFGCINEILRYYIIRKIKICNMPLEQEYIFKLSWIICIYVIIVKN